LVHDACGAGSNMICYILPLSPNASGTHVMCYELWADVAYQVCHHLKEVVSSTCSTLNEAGHALAGVCAVIKKRVTCACDSV